MTPPYPAPVTEWHNDTYDAINPRQPELSQAGRTVVVAGAGQGIGQEIVDVFAQAESAVIHIIGRTPQTIAETKNIVEKRHPNVKVVVHVADIVDTAAVEKAAREIGPWDVIVANAGYIPGPDRIEDSDPEEWWKTFEVNIKGSYVLARAFLPTKKAGGTIIAMSSAFSSLPPAIPFLAGSSAYSISKMGTARFYEFLANKNPDLNVFMLHPGLIRTALYDKSKLELDANIDTVQLPAHFAVWLASPEAKPLPGRFLFTNWDVEQLKSVGGFPFTS